MEDHVTIELFGEKFTFKAKTGVGDPTKVIDVVVEEVNRVEAEEKDHSFNISKLAIMILAALNIANENVELKNQHSKLLLTISEKSTALIQTLDRGLL